MASDSKCSVVDASSLAAEAPQLAQENEQVVPSTPTHATTATPENKQYVILFYKYHPLSPDRKITETYRKALEDLCFALNLTGRILVGANLTEGLNGTLAGNKHDNVRAFTYALLGNREPYKTDLLKLECDVIQTAVTHFWTKSAEYFCAIQQSDLRMSSPDEFKWSQHTDSSNSPLFPDLNVKIVNELIGTGGVLSSISIEETDQGYLTPFEWHQALMRARQQSKHEDIGTSEGNNNNNIKSDGNNNNNNNINSDSDTILIDCRNTKEYEIGRFATALDPQTTTFSQFPKWVKDHSNMLQGKKVLMYCSGGIRCQKASAFIRKEVPTVQQVNHLKGGIHKYLEEFGDDDGGLWQGRYFVFNGRQAATAQEIQNGKDIGKSDDNNESSTKSSQSHNTQPSKAESIVGQCVYCQSPYDFFDPLCVCAVCREPVLTCLSCQKSLREYHCRNHFHLKNCYFTFLQHYSVDELKQQIEELNRHFEPIAIGRKFKQKRKSIEKQINKVLDQIQVKNDTATDSALTNIVKCRSCGDESCTGRCWGFYGLKRKHALEQNNTTDKPSSSSASRPRKVVKEPQKRRRCETSAKDLGLFYPCNVFRDAETGIRVPPCVIRSLQCHVKAKWCGHSVIDMVRHEFAELSNPTVINNVLNNGLLKVNGKAVGIEQAAKTLLKNGDIVSRLLHWHEAPVVVPDELQIQILDLPSSVLTEYNLLDEQNTSLYVCNKPSSVPVHAAGPFFVNTLTTMAEAQLGLCCDAMIPLHRTDRVTSGLTLCCINRKITTIFQKCLFEKSVSKLYVASVCGRFPQNPNELLVLAQDVGKVEWHHKSNCLSVDAPIKTIDPANGLRAIHKDGKESQSLFQFVSYNASGNQSLILCSPISGRNHQLRLHLQWLGYSIVGDIQYGETVTKCEAVGDKVVTLMENSALENQFVERDSSVSNTDAISAKKACWCNQSNKQNIESAFSSAQLLQGGHAIHLHAWKYLIEFVSKNKHNNQATVIDSLECTVDLPSWADSSLLNTSTWLCKD